MKVELHKIKIKDVFDGYYDDEENGVVGYSGKLNIRPKYQREFVYDDKQRNEVINTVRKDFPLNVIYWAQNDDGTFEILDGQQRIVSICRYLDSVYSINEQYFHGLTDVEKEQIENYELMVYFCEGNDKEKLDWFETINIAGEELTPQELKNAIYTGPWLIDAKKYFSKTGCVAYQIANKYLTGTAIRQEYLETILKWISNNQIKKYMSDNQFKSNASELWMYFNSVFTWVKTTFPQYRKEMKGIDWGILYNEFKDQYFDAASLENEISTLMEDEDISNKKGIYKYVLTRKEKYLNLRAFSPKQIREAYEKQKGICPHCKAHNYYKLNEMEGDHITPWSQGGKTSPGNLQMLCKEHNRTKSAK